MQNKLQKILFGSLLAISGLFLIGRPQQAHGLATTTATGMSCTGGTLGASGYTILDGSIGRFCGGISDYYEFTDADFVDYDWYFTGNNGTTTIRVDSMPYAGYVGYKYTKTIGATSTDEYFSATTTTNGAQFFTAYFPKKNDLLIQISTSTTITLYQNSTAGGVFSNSLDYHLLRVPKGAVPLEPDLSFRYPTNLSSTPLFSDFLISVKDLNDDEGYQVRLQYYVTDTATSTTKLSGARGVTDWSGIAYGTGSYLETYGARIPRIDFGVDFADDNVVHAFAQLYATQDPNNPLASLANPIMIASTSVTFTLEAIPTNGGQYITPIFIATTTNPWGQTVSTSTRPIGAIENPTLADASDCTIYQFTDTYSALGINIPFFATSSIDRAVCELKSGINNFIAGLGDFGNGTIETLIEKSKTIFPINIFSHINDDIDLARNATSSFTGDIVLSGPNLFAGRPMTIISASGTAEALDTLGGGDGDAFPIKDFIDKIFYLITGGIIITVSIYEIKSLRDV